MGRTDSTGVTRSVPSWIDFSELAGPLEPGDIVSGRDYWARFRNIKAADRPLRFARSIGLAVLNMAVEILFFGWLPARPEGQTTHIQPPGQQ